MTVSARAAPAADWIASPAFITADHACVSADGMLRNFGKEASRACAQMAAKWAARGDTHAETVWRTIEQQVDRRIASIGHRQEGNYVHIPCRSYSKLPG